VTGGSLSELGGQAGGSERAVPVVPEAEQPDPLLIVFEVRHRSTMTGCGSRSVTQVLQFFSQPVPVISTRAHGRDASVVTGACRRKHGQDCGRGIDPLHRPVPCLRQRRIKPDRWAAGTQVLDFTPEWDYMAGGTKLLLTGSVLPGARTEAHTRPLYIKFDETEVLLTGHLRLVFVVSASATSRGSSSTRQAGLQMAAEPVLVQNCTMPLSGMVIVYCLVPCSPAAQAFTGHRCRDAS